ncbi:MAG: hypothetical protein K0R75_2167 [Paenibacillaceae bacterium]|jgi:hypothetical protein|nr:hypothetical protein [Paenibacillaceae bacterium]
MPKFAWTMLILVLVIGLSICYGVDLATKGLRNAGVQAVTATAYPYDPYVSGTRQSVPPAAAASPWFARSRHEPSKPVPPPMTYVDEDSTINHFANKTGDLLQIFAYYGVRGLTSLFDTLMK